MPAQRCQIDGQSGWKWGNEGKCYVGPDARRKAEAQGKAIGREYLAKAAYRSIDFGVPQAVKAELRRGLKWHEEGHSGDGLKPETVSWARRMAGGADISPDKARKMRAWLARHESDKKGQGFSPGEDGYPSPGRVAWALWGGDPAVGWSNKIVRQMERADQKTSTASLSVVLGSEPPDSFVIFEIGKLSTSKGEFLFDDEAAAQVMAAYEQHGADRLPIDFDHGMLAPIKTPETSVAAGWFTPAIMDGKLMAMGVEWTERAAAMLRSREFRFLSPAFNYDRKSKRITQLLNVALTNLPATHDAAPLVANQLEDDPPSQSREAASQNEVSKVSEKILAVLGAATEDEAVKITKEFNKWSNEILSATGTKSLDDATAAIKLNAELPAQVAELSQQIKQLNDEKSANEREQLIASLSEAGKLPPSLHGWARSQSLESLSAFGDAAPSQVVAADNVQESNSTAIVLSDEDEEAIKLGLATREAFINERKRERKG